MSLLLWNCRGLGNQCIENQYSNLVWTKDPSIVFIAKTWTDKRRLELVQNRLKFRHKFEVPRKDKGLGLVIFWKEDFDLSIETFSKNYIDTTINKNKEDEW